MSRLSRFKHFGIYWSFWLIGLLVTPLATATTIFEGFGIDDAGDTFSGTGSTPLSYGDLTSANVIVDSIGIASFAIRFAPGTIDFVNGLVEIQIDTTPTDANSPNVDYSVQVSGSAGPAYKRVFGNGVILNYVPSFSWVMDGVDISLPLSVLQSYGDFSFRVSSFYYFGGSTSSGTLDYLTGNGINDGPWVQTSAVAPVPEPATLGLLAAPLAGLAWRRRKRH